MYCRGAACFTRALSIHPPSLSFPSPHFQVCHIHYWTPNLPLFSFAPINSPVPQVCHTRYWIWMLDMDTCNQPPLLVAGRSHVDSSGHGSWMLGKGWAGSYAVFAERPWLVRAYFHAVLAKCPWIVRAGITLYWRNALGLERLTIIALCWRNVLGLQGLTTCISLCWRNVFG